MRKLQMLFLAMVFLASASLTIRAQTNPVELQLMADDIERSIMEKMPHWKRQTVKPISRSDDNAAYRDLNQEVVIDQWTSGAKFVKVAILRHRSQEEARKVLQKFTSDFKTIQPLRNQGDEGYAWGVRGSVALRKGSLTIYVSAVAEDTKKEAELSAQFARLVADAISTP